MSKVKIINTLNLEQKKAALSEYKQSLIVASAGTGKTSTIMARIENLIHRGAKPEEIMLITFTNKAASEMLDRLERYFSFETVQKIMAGTFHAIALKHIINNIPNMKIINKFEALSILKNSASKVGIMQTPEDSRYSIMQLHYLFSAYQSSRADSLYEYLVGEKKQGDKKEHNYQSYEDLYEYFQIVKRNSNSFEFNDLLIYAKEFADDIGLSNYSHLIVDEFQDTNPLQEALIDSIEPNTLFCVGDYDQSIYGFNGADIGIITNFMRKYENAGYFNLKRNYRSAPAILSLAEKVISHNERIFPKELIAEYNGETGDEKPQYFTFRNNSEQFESIASNILSIPKHKRNDVAILFRGNSSAAGAEIALQDLDIPYERKSGSSFFDRDDVQIMLSCIVISTGSFKFEDMLKAYYDIDCSHLQLDEAYRAFEDTQFDQSSTVTVNLSQKDADKIFFKQLVHLRKVCRNIKKPTVLIEKVFNSELFEKLLENKVYRGEGLVGDDEKRLKEKQDIINSAASKHKTIERFMRSIEKKNNHKDDEDTPRVQLMSVHASKGLEFNNVYIVDLVEKMFPNQRLMATGGSLEEERRLFYVALTRAKNTLWLCYPTRNERGNMNKPSIFLRESGFVRH